MPLRLIHTADWHLGQTLRGHSRDREHAIVLAQLVDLVSERQPDGLIVAGDLFDSPNPSAEAQKLYYHTLVRLHAACPTMTTVIVAGNHDAATRLEAPRAILAAIRVHVVGNIRRLNGCTQAAGHLIPIFSPHGAVAGHVLAVSYPTAACLPSIETAEGDRPLVAAVSQLYADLVAQTQPQWHGLPLVITGHLHVSGAQQSEGSERSILIGGENAIPFSKFPPEAAYVALGHLHRPQAVGEHHIRYSGSLIPMSSSEIDYSHGVTFVEIEHSTVRPQHLPLGRPLAFHRLPSTGFARPSEVKRLLDSIEATKELSRDLWPFVYLRLSREGLSPAFREEIDQEAESRGLRILEIRLEEPVGLAEGRPGGEAPPITLAQHDPSQLFRLAFAKTHQKEPMSAHISVFDQVLEESQAV